MERWCWERTSTGWGGTLVMWGPIVGNLGLFCGGASWGGALGDPLRRFFRCWPVVAGQHRYPDEVRPQAFAWNRSQQFGPRPGGALKARSSGGRDDQQDSNRRRGGAEVVEEGARVGAQSSHGRAMGGGRGPPLPPPHSFCAG